MGIRTLAGAGTMSVLCFSAFGQSAARPEFEAAVVKLNKVGQSEAFDMLPSGLFSARFVLMNDMFKFAFKVRRETMAGAPSWFMTDRFDITGRAPANSSDETFRLMLQTLLIQEFKIAVHTEQRPMDAFGLVVGKGGPKLQSAAGNAEPECKKVGAQGPEFGGSHMVCANVKMSDLPEVFLDLAPAYIDRPVVDQTGLTGAYDFRLDWVGRNNIDTIGGLTMFGAIEKLGLKLEQKKLVLPVVVIDRVEKLPEN